MHRIHLIWIGFLGLTIFSHSFALSEKGLKETSSFAEQAEALIKPLVASNNFMGTVKVVRGNEVLLDQAYGYSNREKQLPNSTATRFQVASVSKLFTAAAVMKLVEAGQLDLHAPLSAFLPDFPRAEDLTIHHLLVHTSGIPNINGFHNYRQLEQRPQTPAELVAIFRNRDLLFEPGSRRQYSNSNFNLLALLIEQQSGLSYEDYLTKHFFAPLGLSATRHNPGVIPNTKMHAQGYIPDGSAQLKEARSIHWSVKTGNGSLYSTAGDLVTWAQALMGEQVVNSDSWRQMTTDHIDAQGYGLFVRERHGRPAVYINGRSPGFTAYLLMFPEDDLIVAISGNVYMPVATPLGNNLAGLAFGEPIQPTLLQTKPQSQEQLVDFTGSYQFGSDFYQPNVTLQIRIENGYLTSDWGGIFAVTSEKDRFILRYYWSDLRFVRNEDGTITGLQYDSFKGTRL